MLPIYLIPIGDKEMLASVFLVDVKASMRKEFSWRIVTYPVDVWVRI
jgi:hypothetical protein